MEEPRLAHAQVTPRLLAAGVAYVTSEYRLRARVGGKAIDARGLETLVLVEGADGTWKIRHSHTSSRPKPASPKP